MKIYEQDFRRIADYMLSNYGINLENKMTLISGRLSNLVMKSKFQNMHDYIEYMLGDPTEEEVSLLVAKLTTNYTFFMREPQHYEFLEKTVLPGITARNKLGELKIWSAGCSSGEEPYSIAITVKKYLESTEGKWSSKILATDISDNVLKQARLAVYDDMQIKTLEQYSKERYFTGLPNGQHRVSDEIKQMVRFEKFNLMNDFSRFHRKFDIIFCRNVMIYFKTETKQALAGKFYDMLEPGGYFFVGLSETLYNIDTRFKFIKPAIYQKPIN
ncbi:MAG: protein-glutamate O-methyltransferase CheR [Oscillospiraceae bacterium]